MSKLVLYLKDDVESATLTYYNNGDKTGEPGLPDLLHNCFVDSTKKSVDKSKFQNYDEIEAYMDHDLVLKIQKDYDTTNFATFYLANNLTNTTVTFVSENNSSLKLQLIYSTTKPKYKSSIYNINNIQFSGVNILNSASQDDIINLALQFENCYFKLNNYFPITISNYDSTIVFSGVSSDENALKEITCLNGYFEPSENNYVKIQKYYNSESSDSYIALKNTPEAMLNSCNVNISNIFCVLGDNSVSQILNNNKSQTAFGETNCYSLASIFKDCNLLNCLQLMWGKNLSTNTSSPSDISWKNLYILDDNLNQHTFNISYLEKIKQSYRTTLAESRLITFKDIATKDKDTIYLTKTDIGETFFQELICLNIGCNIEDFLGVESLLLDIETFFCNVLNQSNTFKKNNEVISLLKEVSFSENNDKKLKIISDCQNNSYNLVSHDATNQRFVDQGFEYFKEKFDFSILNNLKRKEFNFYFLSCFGGFISKKCVIRKIDKLYRCRFIFSMPQAITESNIRAIFSLFNPKTQDFTDVETLIPNLDIVTYTWVDLSNSFNNCSCQTISFKMPFCGNFNTLGTELRFTNDYQVFDSISLPIFLNIGKDSFQNCKYLNNILNPIRVLTRDSKNFYGGVDWNNNKFEGSNFINCSSLKELSVAGDNNPTAQRYISDNTFSNSLIEGLKVLNMSTVTTSNKNSQYYPQYIWHDINETLSENNILYSGYYVKDFLKTELYLTSPQTYSTGFQNVKITLCLNSGEFFKNVTNIPDNFLLGCAVEVKKVGDQYLVLNGNTNIGEGSFQNTTFIFNTKQDNKVKQLQLYIIFENNLANTLTFKKNSFYNSNLNNIIYITTSSSFKDSLSIVTPNKIADFKVEAGGLLGKNVDDQHRGESEATGQIYMSSFLNTPFIDKIYDMANKNIDSIICIFKNYAVYCKSSFSSIQANQKPYYKYIEIKMTDIVQYPPEYNEYYIKEDLGGNNTMVDINQYDIIEVKSDTITSGLINSFIKTGINKVKQIIFSPQTTGTTITIDTTAILGFQKIINNCDYLESIKIAGHDDIELEQGIYLIKNNYFILKSCNSKLIYLQKDLTTGTAQMFIYLAPKVQNRIIKIGNEEEKSSWSLFSNHNTVNLYSNTNNYNSVLTDCELNICDIISFGTQDFYSETENPITFQKSGQNYYYYPYQSFSSLSQKTIIRKELNNNNYKIIFDNIIKDNQLKKGSIYKDFTFANQDNYQYYLLENNTVNNNFTITPIDYSIKNDNYNSFIYELDLTEDNKYYIKSIWCFKYDVDNNDITCNFSNKEYQSQGRFLKFSLETTKYMSGSFSAVLGVFNENDVYQSSMDLQKQWIEVISNPCPKILKDSHGNVFVIQILSTQIKKDNNAWAKNHNGFLTEKTNLSFNWKECGTIDDLGEFDESYDEFYYYPDIKSYEIAPYDNDYISVYFGPILKRGD